MIWLDVLILSLLLIFVVGIIFILVGAYKESRFTSEKMDIKFSLLIPVKDEEENIERCLDAIRLQNYDLDKVQILILNDHSIDNTIEKIKPYHNSIPTLEILNVNDDDILVGKANALNQGIIYAQNDIVLICDADCAPNPNWFNTMMNQFSEDVGVVSGVTLLDVSLIKNRLFGILQNIDWTFLLGTGAGAVGIGFPISCIGSNLAFRKTAYLEIGGYKKLPFSITEDLSLFKNLSKKTSWKFKFPLSKDSLNWSIPMKDFKALYRQRKRWLFGSFDLNFFGGIMLSAAIFIHTLPIITLFIPMQSQVGVFSIVFVFMLDFVIIGYFLKLLDQIRLIWFIPIYFFYYIFNVAILPFVLIFDRKVIWKNRTYTKRGVLK